MSAEHHMGQSRHVQLYVEHIPPQQPHQKPSQRYQKLLKSLSQRCMMPPELNWDSVLEQTDPRKRGLMSADSDAFKAFLDQINFPG